jgi:hypothetical protein
MRKLLITVSFFITGIITVSAQGELDEQQKVFFRNERAYALMLNSDGLGIGYREAKRINYLNKRFFEVDAGILKHPKEYKISNPYTTGTAFVFGKLNNVFFVRGGLGHQRELFSKSDLGGVAIRFIISGGPVVALYKPIYYKVLYPGEFLGDYIVKEEKFDISLHDPTNIYSRATFTKGLNELKILPGLYGKAGFNFEYSREDKVIHAIEIGTQVNAFPKKVPIMSVPENKAIFFSFFVSYKFGVIVDPLHPDETRLSNLFRRKKSE